MDQRSVADKLSKVFAKVARKLHDVNITSLGTGVEVLRISASTPDSVGETVESLKDFIVSDVFIKRPFSSKVQVFSQRDESTQNSDTTAIDTWDFIPYEIFYKFSGELDSEPVEFFKNDMLVQVLRDAHEVKIPVIYQITRSYGSFSVSNMVRKYAEATLYRGQPSPDIQAMIDTYVNSLT